MQDQVKIAVIIAFACLVMFIFVLSIVVFLLYHQRKMLQKEKTIKIIEQEKQIGIFKASSLAEEKEKQRIAHNLHDEINPMLVILSQNIQKHRFNIQKNNFETKHFENDLDLLEKISQGVRACSYDLVPSYLMEFGLLKSLRDYFQNLSHLEGIKVSYHCVETDDKPMLFSKHEELNIYRMCLELVNNVIKHAVCSRLNCTVLISERDFRLELAHNGRGVSNEEIEELMNKEGGLGLKSLRARALILKAKLVYTKSSESSSVQVTIPFPFQV